MFEHDEYFALELVSFISFTLYAAKWDKRQHTLLSKRTPHTQVKAHTQIQTKSKPKANKQLLRLSTKCMKCSTRSVGDFSVSLIHLFPRHAKRNCLHNIYGNLRTYFLRILIRLSNIQNTILHTVFFCCWSVCASHCMRFMCVLHWFCFSSMRRLFV